jgi:predicted ArsR family transcriptional regulator
LSAGALAERLGITREGVRQQIASLLAEGWVAKAEAAGGTGRVGRPESGYRLTEVGEHLFPKRYDELASALVGAVAEKLGPQALRKVLEAITDARVRTWASRLADVPLAGRVEALAGIYEEGDGFMDVRKVPGGWELVERNCPYLNVALERPALCSTTVSALSRLLGREVVRQERFQDGDGRCVFRISDRRAPRAPGFAPEPERTRRRAG